METKNNSLPAKSYSRHDFSDCTQSALRFQITCCTPDVWYMWLSSVLCCVPCSGLHLTRWILENGGGSGLHPSQVGASCLPIAWQQPHRVPLLCHIAKGTWLLAWDLTQLSCNLIPLTASLILYHMIQHLKFFFHLLPHFENSWQHTANSAQVPFFCLFTFSPPNLSCLSACIWDGRGGEQMNPRLCLTDRPGHILSLTYLGALVAPGHGLV